MDIPDSVTFIEDGAFAGCDRVCIRGWGGLLNVYSVNTYE